MGNDHAAHSSQLKQLAVLRDVSVQRILDVTKPDDWAMMKHLGNGQLVCPSPECRSGFKKPYERNGTRFLVNMPGANCTHPSVSRGQGGGPMGYVHIAMQLRLGEIGQSRGWDPVLEDHPTHADVLFRQFQYIAEIQNWNTDFVGRTAARSAHGCKTIWLFPTGASGAGVTNALFHSPAVRIGFYVHGMPVHLDKDDPRPSDDAQLRVSATVARPTADRTEFMTRGMEAGAFLAEVFSGERRWYPPRELPTEKQSYGIWAKKSDVEIVRATRRRLESVLPQVEPLLNNMDPREPDPLKAECVGNYEQDASDRTDPESACEPFRVGRPDSDMPGETGVVQAFGDREGAAPHRQYFGGFRKWAAKFTIKWVGRLGGWGLR